MEPFICLVIFNTQLSQIYMKIFIAENLTGAIIIYSITLPFFMVNNIHCMSLPFQTLFYRLFRISYFGPSVMSCNFRSGICINHRNNSFGCLDFYFCHYAISFTLVSMKLISSSDRLYFL